jgi:hypothetical protein
MFKRHIPFVTLFVLLTGTVLLSGCTWAKLGELEDKAPAVKLEAVGDIQSSSFGDAIAGAPLRANEEGAWLAISGNAEANIFTANFKNSGQANVSSASITELKEDLQNPQKMLSMALARSEPFETTSKEYQGPFVFLGAVHSGTNFVHVVNLPSFHSMQKVPPVSGAEDFGVGVSAAALAGTTREDLVVGAAGKLFLFGNAGNWPSFKNSSEVKGGWSKDESFSVIAAGEIDSTFDGEEVIFGSPTTDYVAVAFGTKNCVADASDCSNSVQIPYPDPKTQGFGASILIADVMGSSSPELIIGAPNTNNKGEVYVFTIQNGDKNTNPPKAPQFTLAKTLSPPDGADSFGQSLSYGQFIKNGTYHLAVGAPATEGSNGTRNVGAVYLYANGLNDVAATASLSSNETGSLVGLQLTAMPFRVGSESREVLVASGASAVYAIFSNLSSEMVDPRVIPD